MTKLNEPSEWASMKGWDIAGFPWNRSNDPDLSSAGFSWLSPAASVGTTPCGRYVRQVAACPFSRGVGVRLTLERAKGPTLPGSPGSHVPIWGAVPFGLSFQSSASCDAAMCRSQAWHWLWILGFADWGGYFGELFGASFESKSLSVWILDLWHLGGPG